MPGSGNRVRRRISIVLACVGAVIVLGGGLVAYAGHVLSNSRQFATRATSALGDGSMRALIARRVTAEIVAARSELIAVRPLIESAVDAVVRSAPFQSVFEGAVYDLHRSVFSSGNDTFTLRLADVAVLAETSVRAFAPSIAAKLPAQAGNTVATIASGDFKQVSDVARATNRARDAGVWLLVGGAIVMLISIAVAAERVAAVRRAGLGLVVIGLLVVVLYTVARPIVLARFASGDSRTAAGVVWDAFLSDLRVWALLSAAAGGLLAACASVFLAQRGEAGGELLRRAFAGAESGSGAAALVALGLIAVGALAIVAPSTIVSVITVIAGAVLLYAGVRRLMLLALTIDVRALVRRRSQAFRAGRSRLAVVRVIVVAVLLAGVAVGVASLTHGEPALAHPISSCNGYEQLCDRPLNDVVFPATHNSMASATDSGWLFPSQDGGISAQLEAGIRGLLIDTHYGYKASRGIATELTAQTKTLATVVDKVGPEFLASVERLRGSIGFNHSSKRSVYLCHAFCEVGATPAVDALREIRDFLVRHPDQVVILSVEDDVSPQDTEAVFRDSGLLGLAYSDPTRPSGPWPTLRELIEQDRRVIVFAENKTGGIGWYRPQFELMQETPFHFRSVKEIEDPASCRPNRGGTGKPLFLLNNWVDTTPAPRPANAASVNAYQALLARARRCEAARHRIPNLVAVDFYKRGDVLRVAAALNGL
jgi:hypothetical protein